MPHNDRKKLQEIPSKTPIPKKNFEGKLGAGFFAGNILGRPSPEKPIRPAPKKKIDTSLKPKHPRGDQKFSIPKGSKKRRDLSRFRKKFAQRRRR